MTVAWQKAMALLTQPEAPTPDAWAAWLHDRQEAVTALQEIDTQRLNASDKKRLRLLIDEVLSSDAAIADMMRSQQDALKEQLVSSLRNKQALQGYRLDPSVQGRTRSVKA